MLGAVPLRGTAFFISPVRKSELESKDEKNKVSSEKNESF